MTDRRYALQLRDGDPLIAWDSALQTIHAPAIKFTGVNKQLAADAGWIKVVGTTTKSGTFFLRNGSDTSVVRAYQGIVHGTLYKLYVWDTLERFNDLLKTLQ
ncbi:hypothetical protein UFOVP450_111 [uncultured Caudovirales phage]|uniref:Uncharacterized protein n=1 Tax=uncultured Caudovirales phage TaxID=2100421 RepID=A0A6J5M8I3_9CAUD|nr:hypothetical protein UFOVP450_111 [uncultured Caudovirales phage]